jgi:hypothetical protein
MIGSRAAGGTSQPLPSDTMLPVPLRSTLLPELLVWNDILPRSTTLLLVIPAIESFRSLNTEF